MNTLKLAVQKSGRLSDSSLNLIKECGITFPTRIAKLKAQAFNFPVEFLYLRDDDIPGYVADDVADVGIVGKNVLFEKSDNLDIIKNLGFSKCRLSIAVPRDFNYQGVKSLQGLNIATSYPRILSEFLKKQGVTAEIHEISGSVEIAPSIGLAEAVCDIVSTGSTLVSNGLSEVEVILRSEAVLVARPDLAGPQREILEQLLFRINAVQAANNSKYILLNAPNESLNKIIDLLPGMRSPTVLPLAQQGWSSLHSVVKEDDFWEVIEKLRAAGAEGILVIPIEKMIL
ncbi:MAG: ATP phosphoribosyltransferase [Cyclobacteriaceae bacterium]|nr:MAG: ATP phosphoribosyltransferase [Cyclobacteriaceae bacterium]